jgi:hypothetical protein
VTREAEARLDLDCVHTVGLLFLGRFSEAKQSHIHSLCSCILFSSLAHARAFFVVDLVLISCVSILTYTTYSHYNSMNVGERQVIIKHILL